MSGIPAQAKIFECLTCGTPDTLMGTTGQTVTVEKVCECGGKIKISWTFT